MSSMFDPFRGTDDVVDEIIDLAAKLQIYKENEAKLKTIFETTNIKDVVKCEHDISIETIQQRLTCPKCHGYGYYIVMKQDSGGK